MARLAPPPIAPPQPKTPPQPHLAQELLAAIHKKKEAGVYPGVPCN